MTVLNMERFAARSVLAASDEVLMAWPVPSGCTVLNVWHWLSSVAAQNFDVTQVCAYGVDGYLIPLLDPDGGIDIEVIWDTQVPKMNLTLAFEMSDASDTQPRWEPGELLTEALTTMSLNSPEQVFKRRMFITFADVQTGFLAGTPDTYRPVDKYRTHSKKSYFAPRESAYIFGFSNPNMANDVSDAELLPTGVNREWAMLKFIDWVMESMMVDVLGLSTGGTAVPFDEASAFIENIMTDWNVVDDTALFAATSWIVTGGGTMQMRVPGKIPSVQLTTE